MFSIFICIQDFNQMHISYIYCVKKSLCKWIHADVEVSRVHYFPTLGILTL